MDLSKVNNQITRFISFVHEMDGKTGLISFRDGSGFLGREEDYKTQVAVEARAALEIDSWKESKVGNGEISEHAIKAIGKARNLVNVYHQIEFKNRLDKNHPSYRKDAERVLFDIYRNNQIDVSLAFENAVKTFGANYDILAFLFFVKDDSTYLPISTGHFEKGFDLLGIDYKTSRKCSWENYRGFLEIISNIRDILQNTLPMNATPRLIDAHSFVWIIQQKRFIEWIPNEEKLKQVANVVEERLENPVLGKGGKRTFFSNAYIRNKEVVKETRKRANGICQLCNNPAPFNDKNGNPYLEVHHIEWLSRGGIDSTTNTVALCPNCHTRMHILDNQEEKDRLKKICASYGV